jgi:hypothetical protein
LKTFKDLLDHHLFEQAEELLLEDVEYAEDLMDELSDEDYKNIDPHWSAANTGDMISTPVDILKEISDFVNFEENSTLVDLGSGHGYPSFVFSVLNPTLKITGLELVEAKVLGARRTVERLNFKNLDFKVQDLSDESVEIPTADYYFMHNPFNKEIAVDVARRLFEIAQKNEVIILSTGGRELKPLLELGFVTQGKVDSFCVEILKLEI